MFVSPEQFCGPDSERIDAAVSEAKRSGKQLKISARKPNADSDRDYWLIDRAILIPSDFTLIIDNCRVKLSDSSRDNIIRSANCGEGISEISSIANIRILGIGNAVLEGADHPRATGDSAKTLGKQTYGTDSLHPERKQTSDWRNIGVLFAYVSNFTVEGITLRDAHCWALSFEHCSSGTIRNLQLFSNNGKMIDGKFQTFLNQDGLDLRQGCHDIAIENITGHTGDDFIAITAIRFPQSKFRSGDLTSTMVSGHEDKGDADNVYNINVRNIRGHSVGGHHVVRLLNTTGIKLYDVNIEGIVDTSPTDGLDRAVVKIGDGNRLWGGVTPLGDTRNITINNITSRAKNAVLIAGSLSDSAITNVRNLNKEATTLNYAAGMENIRSVTIHNISELQSSNIAKPELELVRHSGDISQPSSGWQYVHEEAGKIVYVPFEGTYESKGGRIQSPKIKLNKPAGEPAYYSLKFKAKTSMPCFWWVDFFDAEGKPLPDINSAVYPNSEQMDYDQMLYVQGRADSLQLAFQSTSGVSVRDIVVTRASAEDAAKWCDSLYKQLPKLEFHPEQESVHLLPRTEAALRNGTPWRVVMLGDSIMNDSCNSLFQALIKRDFPKSNCEFILSVRGSTGCWYYQDPQRFAEYVTRYKPDLLMIGGVSNQVPYEGGNTDKAQAIDLVIRQAKSLGCEVVLLSPPMSTDWRPYDKEKPELPLPMMPHIRWWESTLDHTFNRRLIWTPYEEIAHRNGVAFWNMTKPTADYVANSGMPFEYFNRDYIHNNDRGKQVIGRTLQHYFECFMPQHY